MNKKLLELDQIAINYHSNADVSDMHIENICQEYFLNWLKSFKLKGSRFLELGYGDGLVTDFLSKSECNLTLIEGSGILHKEAQLKYPNINCIHTLFEDFSPCDKFDLILAAHVLEHLDDPKIILSKFREWLAPGGVIIVVVPNQNSLHRQLAVDMGIQETLDALSPRDLLVGHKRVYSLSELKNQLVSSGFKIVDEKGFFIKILPNSMMLNFDLKLLWSLNKVAENMPPELLANIAVVATT